MITAQEALQNVKEYEKAKEQWETTIDENSVKEISAKVEEISKQGYKAYHLFNTGIYKLSPATISYFQQQGYLLGYMDGNERDLILVWDDRDLTKIAEEINKAQVVL